MAAAAISAVDIAAIALDHQRVDRLVQQDSGVLQGPSRLKHRDQNEKSRNASGKPCCITSASWAA